MGGKSAPAPDYTAMAAANQYAAEVSERLGNRQMDIAQQQYREMKPIAQRVYEQQLSAQQQQMQQAQDYYNYQKGTFRPIEQGLARDAQEFSTVGYREQLAREAAAASAQAFGQTQAMASRAAAARGINMNSGAGLAMQNQNTLGLSAQRAQAMTGARTQAEQMGWARRMDVTGLGRNLAGASTAAYQGATGAGTSGLNSAMAPGNAFAQQYGQGVGTMMSGAQMGIQGTGTMLNAQVSQNNAAMNAEGQMYGAILGAGAVAV